MHGFEIDAFDKPADAVKHDANDYDIAILDIRMPGINGFQLFREFEKINPEVKKVLMSSFEMHKSEFDKVMPSTRIGDFILKPISITDLKQTILKHIENLMRLPDD